MAKKAKKQSKTSKSKPKLSWQEEGQKLLQSISKKAGRSATILVLSRNGDLIFREGKKMGADLTSVGALASSIRAAAFQLEQTLKTKASFAQFGEPGKGFWIEEVSEWIVVGIKMKKSAAFQSFYKHLKKKQKHLTSGASGSSTFEALEGLTEAAVDAAFDH